MSISSLQEESIVAQRRKVGRVTWRYSFWGRFVTNPSAVFGSVIVGTMVIVAIFAPVFAPHDPGATNPQLRNAPPAWHAEGNRQNLLGGDPVGRDLLSRIIYGARISLFIGILATAFASIVGVTLGLISGYYGGAVDQAVMRVADVQLAFPFILLAITLIAVLGAGLTNLIVVLVLGGWVTFARLVRGQVLSIREQQYVDAIRVVGARDGRILFRHIAPNIISSVIVLSTLQVAFVIITESALNFLGLGAGPGVPTWGSMLSDGRLYIYTAWWVVTFPGLAIMFTVLGINVLGDWLRDELDPQLRTQ